MEMTTMVKNIKKDLERKAFYWIDSELNSSARYRKQGAASLAEASAERADGALQLGYALDLISDEEHSELNKKYCDAILGIYHDIQKEKQKARDQLRAMKNLGRVFSEKGPKGPDSLSGAAARDALNSAYGAAAQAGKLKRSR